MTEPTYEIKNHNDLNMFLAGVLKDIRRGVISNEQADVISKNADKINKNNIAAILHQKQTNDSTPLAFFSIDKELSI